MNFVGLISSFTWHIDVLNEHHAQIRRDRDQSSVYLVDILQQKFHSYLDVGRAILRLLAQPTVFGALRAGHVIPSVGDHPKQLMERRLLLAGMLHGACDARWRPSNVR